MWLRFASLPIRNAGTLGGNIANGSPIGDSMPGLIAFGARVIVRDGGDVEREMPLEDLYVAYQKKNMAEHEFVVGLKVPTSHGHAQSCNFAPTSCRSASTPDISAVCAAFSFIAGRRADSRAAHRVRRHGSDAEARERTQKPCCAMPNGTAAHGRGDARARQRLRTALRYARDQQLPSGSRKEHAVSLLARNASQQSAAEKLARCARGRRPARLPASPAMSVSSTPQQAHDAHEAHEATRRTQQ